MLARRRVDMGETYILGGWLVRLQTFMHATRCHHTSNGYVVEELCTKKILLVVSLMVELQL